MALKITGHRSFDGWKEESLADLFEKPEPLELVLYRVLHFREPQLDARLLKVRSNSASMSAEVTSTLVTGSAATTSQRTGGGDFATASSTLLEQLGVGEEQRCIPAKQHQTGDLPRVGIAFDVVVARDAVGAAQHRGMRPPAVPQEFDDRDDDRQADAGDGAENGNADEADDRQPEFPTLDAKDADRDP